MQIPSNKQAITTKTHDKHQSRFWIWLKILSDSSSAMKVNFQQNWGGTSLSEASCSTAPRIPSTWIAIAQLWFWVLLAHILCHCEYSRMLWGEPACHRNLKNYILFRSHTTFGLFSGERIPTLVHGILVCTNMTFVNMHSCKREIKFQFSLWSIPPGWIAQYQPKAEPLLLKKVLLSHENFHASLKGLLLLK